MSREYFAAYHSYIKSVEPLSDAARGRLFLACLNYSMTGTEPELRGNERFVWPAMREQIERDKRNYDERCAANRENALHRYANACDGMRTPAKPAKEKEKEKAKGTEKAKETEKAKGTEKAKERPSAEKKEAPPVPDGLRDAVERFKEHRERLNAPMTGYAVSLLLHKLETLSGGAEARKIAILDQSIERGWKGVFPLETGKPSPADAAGNPFKRILAQEAEREATEADALVLGAADNRAAAAEEEMRNERGGRARERLGGGDSI